ncbi:MAG TPA: Bax inhibitor-1 family protein [Polyangiaceae bacterium]
MQSHGYAQPARYAQPAVESRARFIARTYNTLFLAILAFTAIEIAFFMSGVADLVAPMLGRNWLIVLGGFMVASWLGSRVAHTAQSPVAQYAALGGFVFAEAIIFMPMLWIANNYVPGAIQSAALVTLVGFGGLTAIAFWTRKDFSFLGGLLRWGGIVALVLIVASLIFGFQLGVFFSVAMVAFAGAAILYDTSNVLRHFPEDRHVGAALELFSSVALMFWYVLRIFMASRD